MCVWTTCSRPERLLFILYWCLFVAARCEYRFSTGNLNAVLAKIISCLIYLSPGSLWVILEAKWFESDQRWFNIAGLKFCLVWYKLLWNRHWRKTIKVTKQSASGPNVLFVMKSELRRCVQTVNYICKHDCTVLICTLHYDHNSSNLINKIIGQSLKFEQI